MGTPREAKITLLIDGQSFTYQHDDPAESILISAESAGADVPSSCRAGSCGTCIAKVKSGEVDLQSNMFLDDDELEQGLVLLCQAVPTSEEVTLQLIE